VYGVVNRFQSLLECYIVLLRGLKLPLESGNADRLANVTTRVYGQHDFRGNCPCYTSTSTIQPESCPPPNPTSRCPPVPMCLRLVRTTVPGPNPYCGETPTVTSYKACPTTCQRGCGTSVSEQALIRSLNGDAVSINKLLVEVSTRHRLTIIQVTTVTAAEPCPSVSRKHLSSSSSCYTWTTIPSAPYCPGVTGCIDPQCLVLQTATLPPVNPACPVTPVVTATPSCLPTCRDACGTTVTTVKATAL
jgi:hypothetical protein